MKEQPRPAAVCSHLLEALQASEGRRRRRKRDTRPDAIGLAMKRDLLAGAVHEDPDPEAFEAWLIERCRAAGPGNGGVRAMARAILEEWHLARQAESFDTWLRAGAPSDDRA